MTMVTTAGSVGKTLPKIGRFTNARSTAFIASLLVATVLFYPLAPLVHLAWWPFANLQSFYNFLIYLATIHVTLTAFVYFDRSSYRVIAQHPIRFYVVAPGILISFFLIVLLLPKTLTGIFYL